MTSLDYVEKNGKNIEYQLRITVLPKVTSEELSSMETMLQRDHLESSHKETATTIVQKIHETELFNLFRKFYGKSFPSNS